MNKWGKAGVTEVVEDFLDKDQKHFSVGEELSLSIFLLRILAEQRFLAEIKEAWVSSEGEA